jgi:hypothetical protein
LKDETRARTPFIAFRLDPFELDVIGLDRTDPQAIMRDASGRPIEFTTADFDEWKNIGQCQVSRGERADAAGGAGSEPAARCAWRSRAVYLRKSAICHHPADGESVGKWFLTLAKTPCCNLNSGQLFWLFWLFNATADARLLRRRRGAIRMDDTSIPTATHDQVDEDFLSYTVSDEALEAAAGTEWGASLTSQCPDSYGRSCVFPYT